MVLRFPAVWTSPMLMEPDDSRGMLSRQRASIGVTRAPHQRCAATLTRRHVLWCSGSTRQTETRRCTHSPPATAIDVVICGRLADGLSMRERAPLAGRIPISNVRYRGVPMGRGRHGSGRRSCTVEEETSSKGMKLILQPAKQLTHTPPPSHCNTVHCGWTKSATSCGAINELGFVSMTRSALHYVC